MSVTTQIRHDYDQTFITTESETNKLATEIKEELELEKELNHVAHKPLSSQELNESSALHIELVC